MNTGHPLQTAAASQMGFTARYAEPKDSAPACEPTLMGVHQEIENTVERLHAVIGQIEDSLNGPCPVAGSQLKEIGGDGLYETARRSNISLAHLLDRAMKIAQRL